MDTLSLINSNPKFKHVVKDRLFYDRYEFNISFRLDEVSCLRELDHEYIDMLIARRKNWREVAQTRWTGKGFILGKRRKEITDDTVKNLHELAEVLMTAKSEFKLVVSADSAYVYTNDESLINQLDSLPALEYKDYTRAIINRPKNTIKLRDPKHQQRSYFKIAKLTPAEKTFLVQFLTNQADHVRSSPALLTWMTQAFHRTQDYFFIDYDDSSWLTMLSLVKPGLIRKTVQLIKS